MAPLQLLLVAAPFLGTVQLALGFVPMSPSGKVVSSRPLTSLFSTTDEEKKTEKKDSATDEMATAVKAAQEKKDLATPDPDAEGLPWWWEFVWDLDIMQKGEQGQPIKFGDSANVLRTNIEQIYGWVQQKGISCE